MQLSRINKLKNVQKNIVFNDWFLECIIACVHIDNLDKASLFYNSECLLSSFSSETEIENHNLWHINTKFY